MNHNEYKTHVQRTIPGDKPRDELRLNFALGLIGEAGETADLIKKELFHGIPSTNIGYELGDVLWYLVALTLQYPEKFPEETVYTEGWLGRPENFTLSLRLHHSPKYKLASQLVHWSAAVSDYVTHYRDPTLTDVGAVYENILFLTSRYGYTIRDIRKINATKLQKRYPDGWVPGGGNR